MGLIAISDPLSDWDNLPKSHARIGYNNLLSQSDDSETDKALTENTYERWEDASGSMVGDFQLATAFNIDFVAIGAHNLFSSGSTDILIQATLTVGSGYFDVESVSLVNDDAIMILLDDPLENIAEIRITVNGGTNREIGVISSGVALQMYQPIYGGHAPIDLQGVTEYQNSESESGQFLGRTEIRRGLATSYSWQFLDPDWYREKFLPFVISARKKPFFIKWRPDLYEATAYGYATGDIKCQNQGGGHRLMTTGFSVKAHQDL